LKMELLVFSWIKKEVPYLRSYHRIIYKNPST
jgi:hypothetical protein